MRDRFESREDVASKIDYEGGMDSALMYGISWDEMPLGDAELERAWRDMENAWDAYREFAEKVETLLPELW